MLDGGLEKPRPDVPEWVARAAFCLVFCWNVLCAAQFVAAPEAYMAAYELDGMAGAAAVRGLGIAFLMWNATYPAFIAFPRRFRCLGVVVLVQQAIGLFGETGILIALPAGHATLARSIERFIAFDAVGLAVMAAAFAWLLATGASHGREARLHLGDLAFRRRGARRHADGGGTREP